MKPPASPTERVAQQDFAQHGFALIPGVLPTDECQSLDIATLPTGFVGGTRCMLDAPWCGALAKRVRNHAALRVLLPADHVAVQCTYFEKSAARNWLVAVHQDLSIPVAERVDSAALKGWSAKEGLLFVQPPVSVLEQMVAVRIHLDPCTLAEGPLRVVPGSHRRGVIEADAAVAARDAATEVFCEADIGGALVMRPLLLHASSKSQGTGRRRVLHFLFGPKELPLGLKWRVWA